MESHGGGDFGGFSGSDEFQNNPTNPTLFHSPSSENNAISGFQSSPETPPNAISLSPDSNQQGGDVNASGQSSPLGLTLSKTPSFLNLVEKKLSQAREKKRRSDREKIQAKRTDFVSQPLSEKLKASNFPAKFLKIGSWERVSRHEGELIAKCYFAKRKFVWEILEGALKSKIEIQWSDIVAIKATIRDDEPGILELELNQPPLFFRETNPQPRKHTLWQQATDFTGGQAPLFRRHYAMFPAGSLDKHYEKILQCDNRLFMMSQSPFPVHESPCFPRNVYGYSDSPYGYNGNCIFPAAPALQYHGPTLPAPYDHFQNFKPATAHRLAIIDSHSPLSVMDFQLKDDGARNYALENQRANLWNNCASQDQTQGLHTINSTTIHGSNIVLPFQDNSAVNYGDESEGMPNANTGLRLEDIENIFLGDSYCSLMHPVEAANNLNNNSENGVNLVEYKQHQEVANNNDHFTQNDGTGMNVPKPVSWLPPQDTNSNPMMHQQLGNVPLHPYLVSDQVEADFARLNQPLPKRLGPGQDIAIADGRGSVTVPCNYKHSIPSFVPSNLC